MSEPIEREQILIVDDQPLNLKLLTVLMEKQGYRVQTAISGDKALAAISQQRPDIILLDIRMPDMDGFEMCRRLKENPKTHDIPVIMLSILDHAEDKVKALRSGAVDYISKPFQVVEVLARVETHLALHGLRHQLAEKNDQLEARVIARTRELALAQEKLLRQEKLAVLGQLAGSIGHELRNPLGAIKNAAYFLKMALDTRDEEVQEALAILERETQKSAQIITALLDFAGSKTTGQRDVDLNLLLQEILLRLPPPTGVTITWELDETPPLVTADPIQLNQVIENLVRNAYQAMPDGGRLILATERLPDRVCFSIADTGGGIPEENQVRLFEPLFTTRDNGIGLGLSLVKNLVERHGGKIEVTSILDKGSTFTVWLPQTAVEGS